jgi:putative transposase
MSEDAWRLFLSLIERAAPDWPLRAAWRDVRDLARGKGWGWPSYPTVYRRWTALPPSNRRQLREGRAAMVKATAQPVMRDKTTLRPLDLVSLDGRTLDWWADFGDGRAVRPVMIALVDVASNMVLDYELARSENAAATVALIVRTCRRHGIFDRLYTDNGSAFAGHLVAGGAQHRFRTHGRRPDAPTPPGVCEHLGIATTFALPGNARAKIAERSFATLSRVVDDRPEFAGAHAGHAPGASPTAQVRPVPIA